MDLLVTRDTRNNIVVTFHICAFSFLLLQENRTKDTYTFIINPNNYELSSNVVHKSFGPLWTHHKMFYDYYYEPQSCEYLVVVVIRSSFYIFAL